MALVEVSDRAVKSERQQETDRDGSDLDKKKSFQRCGI
jgi:hypothetical protein